MKTKTSCLALLFALLLTVLYANIATLCVGAETNGLEISAPSYYKVENQTETSIQRPEPGTIKTKVSAKNNKSASANATLIVAVYDDVTKALSSLAVDTEAVGANETKELAAQTSLPIADGYTYKYFVWDDFTSLKPQETAPQAPVALSAVPTVHTVMLSWDVADNNAATYRIYRDNSVIGTTQNLYYIDYNLDFDTTYSYAVTACSESGRESAEAELSVTTEAPCYSDLQSTNKGITYNRGQSNSTDSWGETKELNGSSYSRHGYFYKENNGTDKKSGGAWFQLDSDYYTEKASSVYALELTYYIESQTNTVHNILVQYGTTVTTQTIEITSNDLNQWKTSFLTLPGFDGKNFAGDSRGTFRILLDDKTFKEGDGIYFKNVVLMPDAEYTAPGNMNKYQEVSLSLANDNVKGSGLWLSAPETAKTCTGGQDSYTVSSTIGGESCRATKYKTTAADDGTARETNRNFYFRVSDDYMYGPKQNNAVIRFEYFDNGEDYIYLKYNSSDSSKSWSPKTSNKYDKGYKNVTVVKRTNTNTWKTATVYISDACFINAMGRASYGDDLYPSNYRATNNIESVSNNDADFMITAENQVNNELYLKSVSVSMSAAKSTRTQSALYIIGDSTAADWGSSAAPKTGWGTEFSEYVKNLKYVNAAKAGYSTKTFLSLTNEFAATAGDLQKNDYVLISLGHNDSDEKKADGERGTYADTTQDNTTNNYRHNLETMVYKIREKGAIPIFLTSIPLCEFENGAVKEDVVKAYRTVMKDVGNQLSVPVIDVEQLYKTHLNEIGESEAQKEYLFPNITEGYTGETDKVHLSEAGAKTVAKIIANEIVKSDKIRLLKSHIEISNN